MTLDHPSRPVQDASISARDLPKLLASYQHSNNLRGLFELLVTLLPFLVLWAAMWALYEINIWLMLLLAIPTAGFLMRLFMVQHDCGHGSFFSNSKVNDWIGRMLGVLTFTPYGFWKRTHAMHHASSGCLDRRGHGDIDTLTVNEYRARSKWGRFMYRFYRHPLVMLGIGPVYLFLFQHRLPVGLMRAGWRPWLSAMGTNLAIILLAGSLIWLIGLKAFLAVQFPVLMIAGSAGVWLFFVQHQFEGTTWNWAKNWKWAEAALKGSSHYDLPAPLRWMTANIGIHHIHHLSSRIPFYRLATVLRDRPELKDLGRLTIRQSLPCIRLALWDETQQRLISFRDARAVPAA